MPVSITGCRDSPRVLKNKKRTTKTSRGEIVQNTEREKNEGDTGGRTGGTYGG